MCTAYRKHSLNSTLQDMVVDDAMDVENCQTLGDVIHEPELFLDRERAMDFLCAICQCICNTPYDIGCKNGHIYCKQCLNAFFESSVNGQCPQCQDPVNRYGLRINHFALRLLLKSRILCPFNVHNCDDEKEEHLFQCEWIGCFSDVIDHLQNKCEYGSFVHPTAFKRVRTHFGHPHPADEASQSPPKQFKRKQQQQQRPWHISRAELTSYKIYWDELCVEHAHKYHPMLKRSALEFFLLERLKLVRTEVTALLALIMQHAAQHAPAHNANYVSESQFYAAIHLARLHKNPHKPWCDLTTLQTVPKCLSPSNLERVQQNIRRLSMSSMDEDTQSLETSLDHYVQQHAKERKFSSTSGAISLETKIATMQQLKNIVGINKTVKTDTVLVNADKWMITKADIDAYRPWFDVADANKDGCVDGAEAIRFFTRSQYPKSELAIIWHHIDTNKSGKLGRAQFYAFMHILRVLKKSNEQIPSDFVLPTILSESNVSKLMSSDQTQAQTQTQSDADIFGDFVSTHSPQTQSNASKPLDCVDDWGQFGDFDF